MIIEPKLTQESCPMRPWKIKPRTLILLTAVMLISFSGTPVTAAPSIGTGEEDIGIDVEGGYVTKYIWQGYDLLDDNGAWQTGITIDYKGFYAGVWGSWADKGGPVSQDEYDYFAGYEREFLEETRYALDAFAQYTYFNYQQSNSTAADDAETGGQELAVGFSMPNLFPLGPSFVVPRYEGDFEWAGINPSAEVDKGWIHTVGLSYDIPVPELIPGQEEQFLSLGCNISYNDGVFGSAAGWSHSTANISTTFEWKGFSFTPIFYYQWSLEETVNEEDEFYTSFSLDYYF